MRHFSDIFADIFRIPTPEKLGTGGLYVNFYNGAIFDVPITTAIKNAKVEDAKGPGINFKGCDFNFTVRPKPAVDFQI